MANRSPLTEMAEGHLADKYRITHLMGNDRSTHFICLLKGNNPFPIKPESKDSVTVFKNVVFEI